MEEQNCKIQQIDDYVLIPSHISSASCGWGNPNADGLEYTKVPTVYVKGIKNPFFIHASGDSMEPEIHHGDMLICSPDIVPSHRSIIYCNLEGRSYLKALYQKDFQTYLISYNSKYLPIKIRENDNIAIYGVVERIIRDVNRNNFEVDIQLNDFNISNN